MSDAPIDRSRRSFFSGSLFTSDGRKQLQKKIQRSGLHPPGLESFASIEHCQDCAGLCAQNCPQDIIKVHPRDHELHGMPYLDFYHNGCTFCFQCFDACPETSSDQRPSLPYSLGTARLNRDKCYAWNGIVCMSCINSCPHHLFKFDNSRKVNIEQQNCTGCGECIKVCPATAISISA